MPLKTLVSHFVLGYWCDTGVDTEKDISQFTRGMILKALVHVNNNYRFCRAVTCRIRVFEVLERMRGAGKLNQSRMQRNLFLTEREKNTVNKFDVERRF